MGSTSTNNWLGFASFSGAADAVLHPLPPQGEADAEAPMLEDFLGLQEPTAPVAARPFARSGASSIGLSMIKNWLRSQPAPAPAGVDSMALATTATSPERSRKVVDGGESGGIVLVDTAQQRKASVDTFGQRTSIYRGVTKFVLDFISHKRSSCVFRFPATGNDLLGWYWCF
jgi:AP2-like factor (ANT lineage)